MRNISQEELIGPGNCLKVAGPRSRMNEGGLQAKAYVAGSFKRQNEKCAEGQAIGCQEWMLGKLST